MERREKRKMERDRETIEGSGLSGCLCLDHDCTVNAIKRSESYRA